MNTYAIYKNNTLTSYHNYPLVVITCTREEIEELIDRMNNTYGYFKSNYCLGTDYIYEYRRVASYKSVEDFDNFVKEQVEAKLRHDTLKSVYDEL